MKIVVTGGCGFIGSSFVHLCIEKGYEVLVVDKLTYAGNINSIPTPLIPILVKDICDVTSEELGEYDYLVNFAAESHVDNSIKDGKPFLKSNIEGTFNLLELARKNKKLKKFIQISTDEVYGDLDMLKVDASFEQNFLYPSSYYSATKASADMLVYSCGHTFGLPYIITRTCNNFGDRQHNEKFIPTEDNTNQILKLMLGSDVGTFNIGSGESLQNIDIINHIGDLIGKKPKYKFVEDRLGHDRRYTLDTDYTSPKITKTLFEYLKEKI